MPKRKKDTFLRQRRRGTLRCWQCGRTAHHRQIGAGLIWKWTAARKIGGIARRSGMLGAEQAGIAETVMHQAQVKSPGANIVARVLRLGAEPPTGSHLERKSGVEGKRGA